MTQSPDPQSQGEPGIDFTKSGSSAAGDRPAWTPPPPPPPPPGYDQPGAYGPPQGYGSPQGGSPAPPGYGSRLSPSDERTWAGAAHWSALVASLIGLAFLGPLLVMLLKGSESPVVRRQAVESLNFQLTMLIAFIVSAVLILVLIGILLLLIVGVLWLVFTIIGAVKASSGVDYRYPLNLRMVS